MSKELSVKITNYVNKFTLSINNINKLLILILVIIGVIVRIVMTPKIRTNAATRS